MVFLATWYVASAGQSDATREAIRVEGQAELARWQAEYQGAGSDRGTSGRSPAAAAEGRPGALLNPAANSLKVCASLPAAAPPCTRSYGVWG